MCKRFMFPLCLIQVVIMYGTINRYSMFCYYIVFMEFNLETNEGNKVNHVSPVVQT